MGIEGGHTSQDRLRLTVAARREEAAKLIESGLSQRQAAKVLGVSKSALNRDVSQNGTESVPQRTTKAERRAERERELALDQITLPTKRYGVIVADPEVAFRAV